MFSRFKKITEYMIVYSNDFKTYDNVLIFYSQYQMVDSYKHSNIEIR